MVVVTIVGILATLAFVTFRKWSDSSKTIEATSVMRAIAAAQERYRGENLAYLNVSSDGGATPSLTRYYPATPSGDGTRYAWARSSGPDYARWRLLAPNVKQPVAFGYATVAGLPGAAAPAVGLATAIDATAWASVANRPWFVVQSMGYAGSTSSVRVLSSFSNVIAEK